MNLDRPVTLATRVLGGVVLFLLVDTFLWFFPLFWQQVMRPWRAGTFRSQCLALKVGMHRNEVLRLMGHRTNVREEYEHPLASPGEEHYFRFAGDGGYCKVELDPEKETVTRVQLSREPGAVRALPK